MEQGIEVVGLSSLLRDDPRTGGPKAWVPEVSAGLDELTLTLRCNGNEYRAYLTRTDEAARRHHAVQLGGDWSGLWAMTLRELPDAGRGGGSIVAALPTLEAAVVSALCAVYTKDYRRARRG